MPRPVTPPRVRPPIEVVCDFDGTISRPDTVDRILEALADPTWRAIELEWERREIDSRECMARQIPLIRGGWDAVARFLDDHVSVEPSFAPFAAWCAERGIRLAIASEGLDRVIRHLLARADIAVDRTWASRLVEGRHGALSLDFSHASGRTHCGRLLCKCEVFPRDSCGPLRVLIGDGRSDFCAAEHADVTFARASLLDHCRARGVRCVPFDSFDVVGEFIERNIVEPLDRAIAEPAFALEAGR